MTPHIQFWSGISFQIAGIWIRQTFVIDFMFGCGKQLKHWVQMTWTNNESPGICISHGSLKKKKKQGFPCRNGKGPSWTSWHTSKTFKLSQKLRQKISSPLWLHSREMSSLNELEKFSNLKHPIFQGPLDIFQTQTARLIPQQAL